MTTKLTLSIDDSVITRAKKYAKNKGRSLSDLVENYLQSLTAKEDKTEQIAKEILQLKGAIQLPDSFNYKEELGKELAKKYKR